MVALQLEGRWFALGLQWAFALDKAELMRMLRAGGRRAFVEFHSDDGLLYGVAGAGDGSAAATPPAAGMAAAALLVGRLMPDALVHHPLDDGRVWMCAVRDGLPLPDTDRICTPDEAARAAQDVLVYQPGLPRIGSLPGAVETLPALLRRADARLFRQTALRAPAGAAMRWLVPAAIVCMGVVAILWWRHLDRQDQMAAQARNRVQAVTAPDLDALQARYAQEVRDAVEAGRRDMLAQVAFTPIAAAWIDAVRQLPLSVSGYRPRQLDCQVAFCQIEWDWSADAFEETALSRLPGERLPAATPGEYATVARTRAPLAASRTQHYQPMPEEAIDDTLLRLSAATRRYGGRANIGKANQPIVVTLPEAPAALQKSGEAPSPRTQVIGHHGQVRLMASGWAQSQTVLKVMADYPLVPERAVVALNNGNVTMQIEARYIVPLAK